MAATGIKLTTMQTKPAEMTSLLSVLEKLRIRKEDNELKIESEGMTTGNGKFYQPEDLVIIKTYRFEGDSNPSDSSILYLIEANDGLRGYSIDAYGAYTNHDKKYDEFIQKVRVEDRDEQILFAENN
jgi:hypothetical protein